MAALQSSSVGREREMASAVAAIRSGPGVYLVGPAGVGKSRLAESVAEWAATEGWSVVRARATSGASELPLGAFLTQLGANERFLTPMFAEIRERILEGAAGRPVLISIDDVDLLDDASAVLVHQMVAAGEAKVVATLRSGRIAPNELLDLWQRGELRRMDVGPFDRAEAERVADTLAGRALDARTHQRLWEVSAGNALFIHELVTTAAEHGTIVDSVPSDAGAESRGTASITELPLHSPRLVDVVRGRLAHLDDGLRTALLHLAFAEPCGPAELASVADAAMLAALESADLVTVELDRNRLVLRLAHPLYGEVVRLGTGHLQRRAVLATLARDLLATGARRRADVVKLARLAVDGGVEVEPAVLAKAANIAFAAGDLTLTERISRRAFETTGDYAAGWSLANAYLGLGEAEAARELIGSWRHTATDSGERLGVALVESQLEFWVAGNLARATEINNAALAAVPADDPVSRHPVTRDEVLANQAVYEAVSANYDEAWRLAEPLLAHGPDQVLIRAALAAAHALRIGGRPLDALDVVQRALDAYAIIGQECINLSERLMIALRSLCRLQAGDVAGARADAHRAMLNGINEAQLGVAAIGLAAIEVFAGRPTTARPAVEQAMTLWSRMSGAGISQRWVFCAMALVHGSAGTIDAAADALRAFDADTHDAHVFDFGAVLGRARMLAAQGQLQLARESLLAAVPDHRTRNDIGGEITLLYELVRLDLAPQVVDRLEALAKETQGEMFPTMAQHARAFVGGDIVGLGEVADRFATGGLHLFASEAAAQASDAARRAGDQRTAARWLNRAAELRLRCEQPVSQMPIIDAGPIALTRREREIAMLAAQGLASKEIGERLFISRRTAENHLAKVYDKLGVRTRVELARVLDGGVAALAS